MGENGNFDFRHTDKGEILDKIDNVTEDLYFTYNDKAILMESVLTLLYNQREFDWTEKTDSIDEWNLFTVFDTLSNNWLPWEKAIQYLKDEFEKNWVNLIREYKILNSEIQDASKRAHLVYGRIEKDYRWEYDVFDKENTLSWFEETLLTVKSSISQVSNQITAVYSYFDSDEDKAFNFREILKSYLWKLIKDNASLVPDEMLNITNYTVCETDKLTYLEEKISKETANKREKKNELYWDWYEILDTFNWESWLNCMLMEDEKGNLSLTVRWTEISSISDLSSDLSIFKGEIPEQFYELNDYFREKVIPLLEDWNRKIVVEGHSLWGTLAELLMSANLDKFEKSRSFNSPWIADILWDQLDKVIYSVRGFNLSKKYWNLAKEINIESFDKNDLFTINFFKWIKENKPEKNIVDYSTDTLYDFKEEYLNLIALKTNWYTSEEGSWFNLNDMIARKTWTKLEDDNIIKWYKSHWIIGLANELENDLMNITNAIDKSESKKYQQIQEINDMIWERTKSLYRINTINDTRMAFEAMWTVS